VQIQKQEDLFVSKEIDFNHEVIQSREKDIAAVERIMGDINKIASDVNVEVHA
jgi:hypothetical protein